MIFMYIVFISAKERGGVNACTYSAFNTDLLDGCLRNARDEVLRVLHMCLGVRPDPPVPQGRIKGRTIIGYGGLLLQKTSFSN